MGDNQILMWVSPTYFLNKETTWHLPQNRIKLRFCYFPVPNPFNLRQNRNLLKIWGSSDRRVKRDSRHLSSPPNGSIWQVRRRFYWFFLVTNRKKTIFAHLRLGLEFALHRQRLSLCLPKKEFALKITHFLFCVKYLRWAMLQEWHFHKNDKN